MSGAENKARSVGRPRITSPDHVKPSERKLLVWVGEHEGLPVSKGTLANLYGYSVYTVGRAMSSLRRRGLVVVTSRYDEDGTQLPCSYNVTDRARELYPELLRPSGVPSARDGPPGQEAAAHVARATGDGA